jgi:DNA-binding CsgD family transcriptional regulator
VAGVTPFPEVAAPLVEREDELARIEAALDAAVAGAGGVLLIEGRAGIGKTSLLGWARSRAAQRGMAVLHGRGSQLEHEYGMGVVRQALGPAVRDLDPDLLFAGAAVHARSVVLEAPDVTQPAPLGVLHGLYWLVASLAERAPLLVAVDDGHWCDEPSLRFVAYLARRVESLPVALVIATRPPDRGEPVAAIVAEVRADPVTAIVQPGPLGQAGVKAVLGEQADDEFAHACREATGGNPFLLSELVLALRTAGTSFTAPNAGRVAAVSPPTLSRRVDGTLTRLGPQARALVHAVAVLGDGTPLELAAELTGIPVGEAGWVLGGLAGAGVLADAEPLRFLHPLLAAAAAADLPSTERGAMHARAAALLRDRGAGPERVALHLMHTSPAADARVADELHVAATRALARGAPATATTLLRRALAEPPEAVARTGLLLELAEAELAIGDTAAAAADFEQAQRSSDDPLLRAGALIGLFQATSGEFAAQRAMAPTLRVAVPEVTDRDRELGLMLLNLTLLATEPGPEWRGLVAQAQSLSGATPAEALLRGHAALPILQPEQTAAGLAPVAAVAAQMADPLLEQGGTALVITGAVLGLLWTDQLDLARELMGRAVAIAGRRGAIADLALGHQYRASVDIRAGDLLEAEADARTALAAPAGTGWAGLGQGAPISLVGSLIDQGAIDPAQFELSAAGADWDVPDAPALNEMLTVRMRLRAAQGDHRQAIADWTEARRRIERHFKGIFVAFVPSMLDAAESHHVLGQLESRDALLHEALALAEHWGARSYLGETRYRAARLTAGDDAVEIIESAVELLHAAPARLVLARALVSLGELLRRRGRRADSREPLREGYQLARRCGASALAETARSELRASGIRLQRETLAGPDALTASERRITKLAARGATNAEIAQALFLTVKTVEMHLTHAYRKLDVKGRAQLTQALAAHA